MRQILTSVHQLTSRAYARIPVNCGQYFLLILSPMLDVNIDFTEMKKLWEKSKNISATPILARRRSIKF